ncbi:alpha/beta-hydrolase [Thozetella sp. PMI_491]|nr:alpha/beta-hydrolase [Thozetella sp. PMI_491]
MQPIVTIKNGTYAGVYSPGFRQEFFLGMPFAQTTGGQNRFANPVSLNASWAGIRSAAAYSPFCPGYSESATNYSPDEDCLSVNVVRPAGYEGQLLPVATGIFGGGFYAGGSADPSYNLSFIVANSVQMGKPVIAVSMNYRVSGWGYMKSDDLVAEGSTNMGIRDQRLALHWIQENIEPFGGDPTKVTIFGESAGAYSVGYQLVAYNGRDDKLFRGAIMQSGNPFPLKTQQWHFSQPYYDNTAVAVGCGNATDRLVCLRMVPFETLDLYFNKTWDRLFYPQPDGDLFNVSTYDQMMDGQFIKVPLIIGTNSDEGTAFAPRLINNDAQMLAQITAQGLYPDIPAIGIPAVFTDRPDELTYGRQFKRAAAFFGDHLFIADRRLTTMQWSKYNGTTYCYRFNINPYTGGADLSSVTHGSEIPFVFGNTTNPKYFANKPSWYYEQATLINHMWISFFNDLTPNNHGIRGQPQWPLYDGADGYGTNFVFEANATNHLELDTYRAEAIAYLQSIRKKQFKY